MIDLLRHRFEEACKGEYMGAKLRDEAYKFLQENNRAEFRKEYPVIARKMFGDKPKIGLPRRLRRTRKLMPKLAEIQYAELKKREKEAKQ